jgi:hypothetical protein
MENTHTHTHKTFVKATSLGKARLVIKALELSLVPPGDRFPHGIYWAYLFIYLFYLFRKLFQNISVDHDHFQGMCT